MAGGDFTVTRASTKNVLGSAGLYVSVANNVPAFEFNADGTYRGLLVEPGATNLILQSQDFSTTWTNSNTTESTNVAVAPDGASTADKLIDDLTNGQHRIEQGVAMTSGTTYTFSVFAKTAEYRRIGLRTSGDVVTGVFDLTSGTVVTTTGTGSASIESVGNGWYRCSVTGVAGSTATLQNRINLMEDSQTSVIDTFVGTGTDGVLLWQADVVASSVATSPIVTTAGTASRVADDISLSSASSLINQTAGTFYLEVSMSNLGVKSLFTLDSGSSANFVSVSRNASGNFVYTSRKNTGTITTLVTSSGLTANGIYKVGIRYEGGNHALYINGSQIGTSADSANFPSSLSRMIISNATYGFANDHTRSIAVFPVGLTDSQLASLTTL
jgi:hypothetical protein